MAQAPASASGPPLFIVGCARSGTTLLQLMLDAHPDIAIPGESHFIPRAWELRDRFRTADGGLDAEAMARGIVERFQLERWQVPSEAFLRRVRAIPEPDVPALVEALFLAYADTKGKTRWGDKTPGYVTSLPLLGQLFPDGRFLHLVRDGRDVVLSLLDVSFGPDDPAAAAGHWARRVREGRDGGSRLGDRYQEVRYEDLVADPEAVLRTICAFADLAYAPEMLRYHERASEAPTVVRAPPRRGGDSSASHLVQPPTAGIRDWRRDMSAADLGVVEALAGDELRAFGYELSGNPIPLTTRAGATARVWADRLRHRVRGRSGKRPGAAPADQDTPLT